ncbi:MAG: FecR family protein, partial [Nitrospirota bacterium]
MRLSVRAGRISILLLIAILAVPAVKSGAEGPPEGLGMAHVSYLEGDTVFSSADTNGWAALSPNFSLREGDRLWAGDNSKIDVSFKPGQHAFLNYQSELDIIKIDRTANGLIYQVALESGDASFYVRQLKRQEVFQVDTPNTSVRAYGMARFRVSSMDDGTTQVGVQAGTVEVETGQGLTDVHNGEMLVTTPEGDVSIAELPQPDDFDSFVSDRIDRFARPSDSARYLPRDMGDYAYEFDNGGRWVDFPEYGFVWVPTTVSADWSPYSNGRWVWEAGNYIWLPYDPWYAPFHYGRWQFDASMGWFWVPPLRSTAAFWSPGYVGWVWGPQSVYWVPLAPREVYYGYGNYGPNSVNIMKVKVVNVTNVYINSRASNGVVVVKTEDFLHGETRRAGFDTRENPFTDRGIKGTRLIAAPPVKELRPIKDT